MLGAWQHPGCPRSLSTNTSLARQSAFGAHRRACGAFDPEVYGWLAASSDALIGTGLDGTSGSLRYVLLALLEFIEQRDPFACGLVRTELVEILRQELVSMLNAHTDFFDHEEQVVTS